MSRARVEKTPTPKSNWFVSVVGVILCVVFGFVLICNLIIIIKSNIAPEEPPSVLGITPFTVVSGSMSGDREGHLEIGDLILVQRVETSVLQEGDVISFMADGAVITHRIVEIEKVGGQLQFTTKGDANNTIDQAPVFEDQLVGRYLLRIPKAGEFALFLREPMGMVLFVVVPLMLFLFIDVLARRRGTEENSDERKDEPSELELEVARLRALLEAQNAPAAPAVQAPPPVPEAIEQPTEAPVVEERIAVPEIVPIVEVVPASVEAPVTEVVAEPIEKASATVCEATAEAEESEQPEVLVVEPPKAQVDAEIALEEIFAFVRRLEAERNQPPSPPEPVPTVEPEPIVEEAPPEPKPEVVVKETEPMAEEVPPTPAPPPESAPKKPQVKKVHVKPVTMLKVVQTKKR